jgi:rhamnosyltransferase
MTQAVITAVMVTYRPPETVGQAIARVLPQVAHLVIVDNGHNAALKEQVAQNYPQIEWITNPINNLAAAQNLGIARARQHQAEWVLLLDDDSLLEPHYVAALLQAHSSHDSERPVGIIGGYYDEQAIARAPHYYQRFMGGFFRRVYFNGPVLDQLWYVPASGSLIALSTFDKIGVMDEKLGIYFVDTDFCLRTQLAGLDIIAIRDARLAHRFGKRTAHKMGKVEVSTTNHCAESRYRMFKNRKIMWARYALKLPGYVLFDSLRAVSEMLRIILWEENRTEKLVAINRAFLGLDYA